MVTEKLKLLNDQSYFLVSDVSVVCPRCGARLAANRSPVSLVPAGPGGFRCSPPRTRNAGAVGPHDPQVPVFRILLTRQLRTACAYRRTVAAGKVAGSFPRSGVRTTFACSSFLFPDCAAQSRTVRIAPHCVVPGLTVRPVLHCAVPGCSEAECSRRAVSQRPGRAVVWPCILCRTVQTLRIRAESSRPVPFAPRRSAGYGVSRRREILPAAPPFSDGDCGEDRSDEPKPKPSAPPRSNSQRDPRRQPFRCRRRKRGVPKAARGAVGSRPLPPFLPVVGASDSLLSAAGTARSPVRRHSPNRRR